VFLEAYAGDANGDGAYSVLPARLPESSRVIC
jgi:hypothetical protein